MKAGALNSASEQFGSADWLVLLAYLAVVSFVGIKLAGKNSKAGDFLFGAGQVPWLAVGLSLIATSVSATTFLGNPAQVYATDMSYLLLNIGTFLGILIIWKWFIPKIRESGIHSAYEILEKSFNRPVRLLAAVLYSFHLLMRTGILLYGPSLVLAPVLGIQVWQAILLAAVLASLYTWFGGISAVIWTDVIQFIVLLGGGFSVLWILADRSGGFAVMFGLAAEAGKTTVLHLSADNIAGSLFNPLDARSFLAAGLIYVVFEVAIRGCDQQFIQRYLSCKSVNAAQKSSIASAVFGLIIGLLFFSIGAGLWVFYQINATDLPAGATADQVFPWFMVNELPVGLKGLLVAAVFAAAMSSLDSAVSALANTTLIDFRRIRPDSPESLREVRIWTIVFAVLGTGAAFVAAAGDKSLLTKALFFTSLFTGPLLGMFLLAFSGRSLRPWAVFWGTIAGMLCLLPFSRFPNFGFFAGWDPIVSLPWQWNPLISLLGMLFFTLVIHFMLKTFLAEKQKT